MLEFFKEKHFFLITLWYIMVILLKFLTFIFILYWCTYCIKTVEIWDKFLTILNQINVFTNLSPFRLWCIDFYIYSVIENGMFLIFTWHICLIFFMLLPFFLVFTSSPFLFHPPPQVNIRTFVCFSLLNHCPIAGYLDYFFSFFSFFLLLHWWCS